MRRLTAGSGGVVRFLVTMSIEVIFEVADELLVDPQRTREHAREETSCGPRR
jgi:hypothetical protein